jgi:two-component system response regulator NreC
MDDHPVVRLGLIAALNNEPDLVVVADGGKAEEAVGLVERHKPDVVLLDIQMDQSTFGFVSRIKETNPDTKVLFVSAYDSPNNAEQVTLFGGSGLVSKQEGTPAICEAIRRVHAGETYFSERIAGQGNGSSATIAHPLSRREVDVLCCVAHAMTAKEIAKNLKISVKTVDRHKANIMHKLSMRSQSELVRYAIRSGFVSP